MGTGSCIARILTLVELTSPQLAKLDGRLHLTAQNVGHVFVFPTLAKSEIAGISAISVMLLDRAAHLPMGAGGL